MPGIKGAVDLDVFKGTTSQLGQLAGPTTAPGKARPAIVSPTTGVVSVFFKGFDGNLWWMTYTPSTGWSTAASLGDGTLGSDPVVTARANGNYDVFWTGTDGAIWHTWNSGTTWYHQSFGGSVSGVPAAVTDHNGGVDVLWHGTDGGLWSKQYCPRRAGRRIPKSPVLGADLLQPGRSGELRRRGRCVLARLQQQVCTPVRRPSATAAWASGRFRPARLGGRRADADLRQLGVIDVFYRGTDGSLWHSYTPTASGWSKPYRSRLGAAGKRPGCGGQDHRRRGRAVARVRTGSWYHAWFSGGPWTAVKLAGQAQTQPSMVAQASGAVDAVFNDQARSVGHTYYVQGGSWHSPGTLGGFLS